ncbi:MFS transporter [Rhodoferax saidenbachensis]|uniref:MFS family arabinose efflux permease n=1 Tax=Rhodoferax saidenbachensis TaxID=1484693 RepID=A0ABU1ZL73_9BURK|nr:MFS transporter [Rhodoferax saidenbachensis]MDR7306305.1 putative MFS family arabinose efflux permease [Rhodoferax saidenbachensis]
MPIALTPRRELWLLITLAGIQFTNILDFMIMMPLGPALTQLFGISDAKFGLLVSAYTLAGGVSGLAASTYIDRFGRKRLMLVLYGLFALSTLACGLASTYGELMAARISAGIFGGVLSALGQTIIGDVIPFERRGRAMGIVMTSFSVSTVAGVPLGLFLAAHLGWHVPFFGIAAMCLLLMVFAQLSMPVLNAHLALHAPASSWSRIREALQDANHQRAFMFSSLLMFAGFTVIPYITIYMQTNVGLHADQIPYIYLCGGVATLVSARWVGRVADSWGKFKTFRVMAVAVVVPMLATTLLGPVGLYWALPVSTLFFVCMSGRMIPGMAMLTSAANPALRGTFMTLNSAVQSAAMGVAALVGGAIISRDAAGLVQNYWMAAVVGGTASILAVVLGSRLNLQPAMPSVPK